MDTPTTTPTTRADEAAIRSLLARRTAATTAKDPSATIAAFTADPIVFDLAPPLVHDADLVRDPANLNQWFSTWDGPIHLDTRDLEIHVGGDIAYATALLRMRGTKTGGERSDLWFRSTVGLRREHGAWKIAHEHNSVPFLMDGSYRAAVDLRPGDDAPPAPADSEQVVRRMIAAYHAADRETAEALLAADFTFTSPHDDAIDRQTYFARCWPGAGTFRSFTITELIARGDACFVRYDGEGPSGSRFHNTEHFRCRRGQITAIDVFFGRPPSPLVVRRVTAR
jgi:ketosteroid isomerase-like protein